jgi:hypothetical protein
LTTRERFCQYCDPVQARQTARSSFYVLSRLFDDDDSNADPGWAPSPTSAAAGHEHSRNQFAKEEVLFEAEERERQKKGASTGTRTADRKGTDPVLITSLNFLIAFLTEAIPWAQKVAAKIRFENRFQIERHRPQFDHLTTFSALWAIAS